MATQKLIAKERFYYGGRNVEMGEEFDAEEMDVALLIHSHTPKATVLEMTPTLGKDKPGKAIEDEPKPRTYKRRDMKAED